MLNLKSQRAMGIIMYCFKCGKELDASVKFCPNCGQSQQISTKENQPEITQNNNSHTQNSNNKNKFNKKMYQSLCFVLYVLLV